MVMTDPIADMLTRIRNASHARHDSVDIPSSRVKKELARVLKEEGYLRDVRILQDGPVETIRVYLKYGPQKRESSRGIRRISQPGRRGYATTDQVPTVLGGLGIAVLSTSRGVMTDRQARKERVGGEVICYVW